MKTSKNQELIEQLLKKSRDEITALQKLLDAFNNIEINDEVKTGKKNGQRKDAGNQHTTKK